MDIFLLEGTHAAALITRVAVKELNRCSVEVVTDLIGA
jgi:hypothetical protein